MLDVGIVKCMSNDKYYMIEFCLALSSTYRVIYDIDAGTLRFWADSITYKGHNAYDFYNISIKRMSPNKNKASILRGLECISIYVYNNVPITEIIPEVVINSLGGYNKLLKEARRVVVDSIL